MAVSKSLFLSSFLFCFASVKSGVFFVSFRRGVLTRFSIGFFFSFWGDFCRCIQEQKRERERERTMSRETTSPDEDGNEKEEEEEEEEEVQSETQSKQTRVHGHVQS